MCACSVHRIVVCGVLDPWKIMRTPFQVIVHGGTPLNDESGKPLTTANVADGTRRLIFRGSKYTKRLVVAGLSVAITASYVLC